MRVHDEAFPADGGAGFLKIDAHHNRDAVGHFFGKGSEAAGVIGSGGGVVDRARADDQEEAFVVREDEAANIGAGAGDEVGLGLGLGQLGEELAGSGKWTCLDDVEVGGLLHEGAEIGPFAVFVASFGSNRRARKRSWPVAYP